MAASRLGVEGAVHFTALPAQVRVALAGHAFRAVFAADRVTKADRQVATGDLAVRVANELRPRLETAGLPRRWLRRLRVDLDMDGTGAVLMRTEAPWRVDLSLDHALAALAGSWPTNQDIDATIQRLRASTAPGLPSEAVLEVPCRGQLHHLALRDDQLVLLDHTSPEDDRGSGCALTIGAWPLDVASGVDASAARPSRTPSARCSQVTRTTRCMDDPSSDAASWLVETRPTTAVRAALASHRGAMSMDGGGAQEPGLVQSGCDTWLQPSQMGVDGERLRSRTRPGVAFDADDLEG